MEKIGYDPLLFKQRKRKTGRKVKDKTKRRKKLTHGIDRTDLKYKWWKKG